MLRRLEVPISEGLWASLQCGMTGKGQSGPNPRDPSLKVIPTLGPKEEIGPTLRRFQSPG